MCILTVGVGHVVVVCHVVGKHRGRQVCVFGKASDLESNLEESHGVGMYGLTPCADMK